MKAYSKKTKRNTYLKLDSVVFRTNNNWADHNFEKVDFSKLHEDQKSSIEIEYGWQELGECNSIDEVYQLHIQNLKYESEQRKIRNADRQILINQKKQATREKFNKLLELDEIPTTLENIEIVLECLNEQNWGTWRLPKMSIGYSANQYDCDGIIATTIKLDKPIDGTTMFKVCGKRGHLNKYRSI